VVLPLLSFLVGESRLLVSWCAGGRCGMAGNNEDHGRSRRPSAEDYEWLGDAVCSLHCARGDEEREFLGLSSKSRSTVC
jgi:hypothetical protein